jgi:hypothetical protein
VKRSCRSSTRSVLRVAMANPPQGPKDVEGDVAKVPELFGLLDDVAPMFEVVEPKRKP